MEVSSRENHLYLWAIYTMAMLVITRVYSWVMCGISILYSQSLDIQPIIAGKSYCTASTMGYLICSKKHGLVGGFNHLEKY